MSPEKSILWTLYKQHNEKRYKIQNYLREQRNIFMQKYRSVNAIWVSETICSLTSRTSHVLKKRPVLKQLPYQMAFSLISVCPLLPLPVMPRQDGKVAIVTGGGRGIGFEVVRHMARLGAHVIIGTVSSTTPLTCKQDYGQEIQAFSRRNTCAIKRLASTSSHSNLQQPEKQRNNNDINIVR